LIGEDFFAYRQYWTSVVGPNLEKPRKPVSAGAAINSLSIFGIALKTGSHLWIFQTLFMRIPIRNTTKWPSFEPIRDLVE
jgi:hypothetical protein